jgi:IS5 family transposase
VQGKSVKTFKTRAPGRGAIYRKQKNQPIFEDFYLPFGGKLRSDNRWVKLAKLIPWDEIEEQYADNFADSGMGAPAKAARIALGALIIQEKLGLTDEETVCQIQENPYLQYFIGYGGYREEAPFHETMMVHFRKRLNLGELGEINELIHRRYRERQKAKGSGVKTGKKGDGDGSNTGDVDHARGGGSEEGSEEENPNQGKLIVDASCTPADIRYPTDLSLLKEAREKSEGIIDRLHEPLRGEKKKPRTYRERARRDYLKAAKKRNLGGKELHKALGKQLRYLRRDLGHIEGLAEKSSLQLLSRREYRNLLVIEEVYGQQKRMYEEGTRRIDDRIVSISQPHVRPIVRGKAGVPVEFGAKISVSLVEGYTFIDRMSWDNFNESGELIEQIEGYRERFGCYPESVHADRIYRSRDNLKYCTRHGIRLSGPKLGRPKRVVDPAERKQMRADELERNAVEGKFGQGKRRYGLGLIRAKLAETSGSMIGMAILVMNLEKLLREVFWLLWKKAVFGVFYRAQWSFCEP